MSDVPEYPGADPDTERALFAHPGVDVPTLLLAAAMWVGLVANFAWAWREPGPWWAHLLVGTFFLNMSFTVWHEAVHGTAFRSRWANDALGVLGAWPALIPYFMIRTVHRLHHEHTNDAERDPDAWFLDGSIWTLPLRYARGIRRAREHYRATGPPAWEARADALLSLLAVGLAVLALVQGGLFAVVFAWALPKGVAMWIHAWYVNWLPHRALPAERYRDTRVFPFAWLTPWMLFHNYHGLHHAWQTVPWHRYGRAFRAKAAFLRERGTPIQEHLTTT